MDDVVVRLDNVSKFYKLYNSSGDRLKEALSPFGKVYHKVFYASKNINLEVKKGEILGIVGKNGCGKSTLLKLISGVLIPNDGKVTINGKISALLELGSGFNPEFTGMQNIFFYGAILGFSKTEMIERLDTILEFAEIGDFINQPLKTYSSGMKSRLGFAVAIHIDPEILILDEVLSVGDALFQRKCFAKMQEFFNGGKTILYVSHNIDTIKRLCTRAVLIEDGCITMDADAKSVTARYQQLLFSKNTVSCHKVADSSGKSSGDVVANGDMSSFDLVHKSEYIPGFVSKSVVEIKNHDVLIKNARIVDDQGFRVNLLEFKENYHFLVEVLFNEDIEKVAFGLEIKDEKGVLVATVDSVRMAEMGRFYFAPKDSVYELRYSFNCCFRTGMYYMNFGASSFDGVQTILHRILDVLVFKVSNTQGYSSGYVDLINKVQISNGEMTEIIEILS